MKKTLQTFIILVLGTTISLKLYIMGDYSLLILNILFQLYLYHTAVIQDNYILEPIYKLFRKYK